MTKKANFKIVGMHCSSCAMDIDMTLEETAGVSKVNTNYAKAETQVEYDEQAIGIDEIKKQIKNVGYDAVDTNG